MSSHHIDKALIKQIFKQLSGTLEADDELIPEAAIKGRGTLWCYDIGERQIVNISRGIKCYILNETKDNNGRILVYTLSNNVILIEEDELIYTGFD